MCRTPRFSSISEQRHRHLDVFVSSVRDLTPPPTHPPTWQEGVLPCRALTGFLLPLNRVAPCVMILTATAPSWTSPGAESRAAPPAPGPGPRPRSCIRAPRRRPTPGLCREDKTPPHSPLLAPVTVSEQPSQTHTYLSARYITVVVGWGQGGAGGGAASTLRLGHVCRVVC